MHNRSKLLENKIKYKASFPYTMLNIDTMFIDLMTGWAYSVVRGNK